MQLDQYLRDHNLSQADFGRRLPNPVSGGMVGHWITRRYVPTAERAKEIELATGGLVKRHELRPDIFDAPAVPAAAEEGAT